MDSQDLGTGIFGKDDLTPRFRTAYVIREGRKLGKSDDQIRAEIREIYGSFPGRMGQNLAQILATKYEEAAIELLAMPREDFEEQFLDNDPKPYDSNWDMTMAYQARQAQKPNAEPASDPQRD